MRKTSGRFGATAGVTVLMGMMLGAAIAAPAQTFTTLVNLDRTTGVESGLTTLVQGTDGNLYGTTAGNEGSGTYNSGTVFKITLSGSLTTLHIFCSQSGCIDGHQRHV